MRRGVVTLTVLAVVAAALALAALFAWPRATPAAPGEALARVSLPGFAGHVVAVRVRDENGGEVAVRLRGGELWPRQAVSPGERLTVSLSVRRPGWIGWLVGRTDRRTFTVDTPTVALRGRWLQVRAGAPVRIAFSAPVSLVSLDRGAPRRLARPSRVVPTAFTARGRHAAGAVQVAAAARPWERLPRPVRVSWFPAKPYPQLLATPRAGGSLPPAARLTLTFSLPVRDVLGSRRPALTPATQGRWMQLDAHTLAFRPAAFGFGLGAHVNIRLPRAVHIAGAAAARLTRTLHWQVPPGSTLRLQQVLAELGYLPVDWKPVADSRTSTVRQELAAAVSPPPGRFTWRYSGTPSELQALWRPGEANTITRGAVMMFEDTHDLAVDGFAGPNVWRALIADAVAGKRRADGYSYVFVHRNVPQSLNLWHAGHVILSSPGNTGVPAAPTVLGTFPVFEHIPVGTMSGTNPDGSHYNDPGIRYISYFNGGDAIHAFNRSSFGTPQSLGCVELPLDAAAKVWPYTPIGTLVTIEN